MKKTAKNPKQTYEFYNDGLMKANQKRYSEAIQSLNEAIRIDRYYVKAYNLLGKVYLHTGEIQKAQECWLTALSIDELNPTAIACLNALNQESFPAKLKNILPAVFLFFALAVFLFLLFRISDDIKELNLKLSQINKRLITLEVEDSLKVAMQQNEDVVRKPEPKPPIQEVSPSPIEAPSPLNHKQIENIYKQALAYFDSGEYDTAITEFQKILDSNADSHLMDNAQYWLADCYYNKGAYELSAQLFAQVKDFPDGNKVADANKKIRMIKALIEDGGRR